jgi:glutamate-1-semialdehyde 2,1-aminomutase
VRTASAALFERARAVIAGGITHDGRYLRPFPVYIARARGSYKWDVQGREYIDYRMGHACRAPRRSALPGIC